MKTVPGWEEELPSKWYSGYIDAGTVNDFDLTYHYIFIESENDPTSDPILLWSNGGPGASSFFGLFTEIGPFTLSSESLTTKAFNATGVPTLLRNHFGWTKFANLLILSGPPPVSFGYCNPPGPTGSGFQCGQWNDELTAEANYNFLENFYVKFPHLSSHDLFLSGESYAGIYIPTLARKILDNPESLLASVLKGFAIGDGCVGKDIICSGGTGPRPIHQQMFRIEFLHGHGQFSTLLYNRIKTACRQFEFKFRMDFIQSMDLGNSLDGNEECLTQLAKVDAEVGAYFPYNLYDDCWDGTDEDSSSQTPRLRSYACGGQKALSIWVGSDVVREALHVNLDSNFVSGDNGAGLNYSISERNLMPFYRHVAGETPLRVLIYNGDTDPGLNSFVGESWTSSLGLNVKRSWRPYTLDGKKLVVGYITQYMGKFRYIEFILNFRFIGFKILGNLDYMTIRGSGHMVPQYKPQVAAMFISRWLKNEALPEFQSSKL